MDPQTPLPASSINLSDPPCQTASWSVQAFFHNALDRQTYRWLPEKFDHYRPLLLYRQQHGLIVHVVADQWIVVTNKPVNELQSSAWNRWVKQSILCRTTVGEEWIKLSRKGKQYHKGIAILAACQHLCLTLHLMACLVSVRYKSALLLKYYYCPLFDVTRHLC